MQTEHLENHTARITVEVDPERVEKAMRQAGRKISQKARIPGFRPGKAPYEMVERAFGREYILNEALDTLGQEIYRETLDESQIEPYAPGSLEDIQTEGGLKLTFVIPKRPTIELGNYRDEIRVPYDVEEVTDETVNKAMEDTRQNNAVVEDVDRPAQLGDQITFDHFEVVVLADEKAEADAEEEQPAEENAESEAEEASESDDEGEDENGERLLIHQHNFERVLRTDDDDLFPGFSQHFVDAKVGDELEFTLTLPDDHDVDDLKGRTLRVEAVVEKIQSRTVADWSDTLAETLSDGKLKTMLEYRVDLRQQLETQAKYNADQKVADEAMKKLVELAEFHYPEEAVHDYASDVLSELDNILQQQGLRLADYMRIMNKTEDDLRVEYRDRAIERLERSLALAEFVKHEGLLITDTDVDTEIEQMVTMLGGEQADQFRQFLTTSQSRFNIANRLASNRAFARLTAIAKGENPPIETPAEEPEVVSEVAPHTEPDTEA
ncbi:MAG TPA: trigger factor [Aggregatilineaceae bacterium]|nr:trigger factor [Aggregatilineaceae bacterium]